METVATRSEAPVMLMVDEIKRLLASDGYVNLQFDQRMTLIKSILSRGGVSVGEEDRQSFFVADPKAETQSGLSRHVQKIRMLSRRQLPPLTYHSSPITNAVSDVSVSDQEASALAGFPVVPVVCLEQAEENGSSPSEEDSFIAYLNDRVQVKIGGLKPTLDADGTVVFNPLQLLGFNEKPGTAIQTEAGISRVLSGRPHRVRGENLSFRAIPKARMYFYVSVGSKTINGCELITEEHKIVNRDLLYTSPIPKLAVRGARNRRIELRNVSRVYVEYDEEEGVYRSKITTQEKGLQKIWEFVVNGAGKVIRVLNQ